MSPPESDYFTAKPLISIIMPTHNNDSVIGDAIRSVQAQTYPHWELIVVNDASTDQTVSVVRQFMNDPRIRLLNSPKRLGKPSKARNLGLAQAQGELITFLDADDQYFHFALQTLSEPLVSQPEPQVAPQVSMGFPFYCDAEMSPLHPSRHLIPSPEGRYQIHPNYKLDWPQICAQRINFFVSCTMLRRSLLEKVGAMDESLTTGEDFKFLVQLFKETGSQFQVLPVCTYRYRVYNSSISRHPDRILQNQASHRQLADWLFSPEVSPAQYHHLRGQFLAFHMAAGMRLLAMCGHRKLALKMCREAWWDPELSPTDWWRNFPRPMLRLLFPKGLGQPMLSLRLPDSTDTETSPDQAAS